jgi:hypothetical protein
MADPASYPTSYGKAYRVGFKSKREVFDISSSSYRRGAVDGVIVIEAKQNWLFNLW